LFDCGNGASTGTRRFYFPGSDLDVKKWAADTSKMVQKHLELAKQTQSKLK